MLVITIFLNKWQQNHVSLVQILKITIFLNFGHFISISLWNIFLWYVFFLILTVSWHFSRRFRIYQQITVLIFINISCWSHSRNINRPFLDQTSMKITLGKLSVTYIFQMNDQWLCEFIFYGLVIIGNSLEVEIF